MESAPFAEPVAPWLGGKSRLAKTIIDKISAIEHGIYAEPFVGMGGIFLRRTMRPKSEVVNDLNGEIINLFRILQRHYPQFIDHLKFQVTSRREFERLRVTDPKTLTDLERASRFLYLQRCAFGGKPDATFGVSPSTPARFDLSKIGQSLEAAHERLSGVVFESLPWADFIDRYDSPQTLFYLDPPYWGGEMDYGKGMFDRSEFRKIARRLEGIKGTWLLSINDTPQIRELFEGFHLEPLHVSYSIARTRSPTDPKAKPAKELLISPTPIVSGFL